MKVLITGITGFVGSHLAEYLLKQGYEVYGIVRHRSKMDNISHIKGLHLLVADLRDANSIEKALMESTPKFIFHLAAQSYVPMSWRAPIDTMETNLIGTMNLYEAVLKSALDPVIQFAGSSEEYGYVNPVTELPITEENELRPLSPYGVSKVAGDRLSYQYVRSYNMKIVITRAFNHEGPRRGDVFVTSSFAKQIAEIENGAEPIIKVGNLDAVRDFTDVRDMVKAYLLAVKKCQYGVPYNICSGQSITMESLLNRLLSMSKIHVTVEQDPDRMRPSDVPILQGDCYQFKNATGWERSYTLDETLEDLLNYWREKCRK